MVSIQIDIDEELYKKAEKCSKAEGRSIEKQIEWWARLGKCALDNTDLPVEFIRELLLVKTQDLSLAELFRFSQED